MAPVLAELRRHPDQFETMLCVTAQHRQILDQMLASFEIIPDIDLNLTRPRQTLANLTAKILAEVTKVLARESPDCVLIQGDTTTAMTVALASFYHRIPVGHVEAGLRTGNRYSPFPEEINRRLVSVLSTYHFAPTQVAVQALKREGMPESFIWCTGNTVVDALLMTLAKPCKEGWGVKLNADRRLILVTAHRRENFGKPFEQVLLALRQIAERNPDVEIVYPVHLNPNVQNPVSRLLKGVNRIHLIEPLAYLPFVHLMRRAYLVLTDSGGIQEEAAALGIPVLVLRRDTERPEAVLSGTAKLVGTDLHTIIKEVERLLRDRTSYEKMAQPVSLYGDGNASKRIVSILSQQLWRNNDTTGGRDDSDEKENQE